MISLSCSSGGVSLRAAFFCICMAPQSAVGPGEGVPSAVAWPRAGKPPGLMWLRMFCGCQPAHCQRVGDMGRFGRQNGLFHGLKRAFLQCQTAVGIILRCIMTMPKFTSHFSHSFTAIVYILEHPLLNDFTALEKCPCDYA